MAEGKAQKMTLEEVAKAHRESKPIIHKANFGFMLSPGFNDETGYFDIKTSTEASEIRGPAEAEYVRKVVRSWSEALRRWDEKKDL